jgi:hypothetical protein
MSADRRQGLALGLLAFAAAAFAAAPVWAQSAPINCFAAITSPTPGSTVPLSGTVAGVSDAKGNIAVWVLTHRKGISDWWPQGGGPVSGIGNWSAQVTFGTDKEAGQPFEIAVVPVDVRTNEGLAGWMARAATYNEYPGIPLPTPAKGCRTQIIAVQRN